MPIEEKKLYRVIRPLRHDKTDFAANDGIELTDREAGHLLASSAIEVPASATTLVAKNASSEELNLNAMTKPQLVAHAAEVHSLDLKESQPKPDLIAAITEAAAKGGQESNT